MSGSASLTPGWTSLRGWMFSYPAPEVGLCLCHVESLKCTGGFVLGADFCDSQGHGAV